jgi:DNA-binding response OmpR family regulator
MIGHRLPKWEGHAIKILLIEDDTKVAELLARAFDDAGHQTTVSYSGEEGLRSLERERPDALFLDVRLPKMNGIEVLRRIRATDRNLPVILITGHATPGEVAEARTLGVTEIIEKPYVLNHFSGALARISPETGQA